MRHYFINKKIYRTFCYLVCHIAKMKCTHKIICPGGNIFIKIPSYSIWRASNYPKSSRLSLLTDLPGVDSPVFSVAYRPDGQQIALGGFDGKIRLYDVKTGKQVKTFVPVKVTPTVAATR